MTNYGVVVPGALNSVHVDESESPVPCRGEV